MVEKIFLYDENTNHRQNLPEIYTFLSSSRAREYSVKIMEQFDIVVVGCGLSGLAAARQCLRLEPKLRVLLLEAKGMV